MKLDLTDTARWWRTETGCIDEDSQGRETLTGLNYEESVWLVDFQKQFMSNRNDSYPKGDREKYFALHDRHDRARMIKLAAFHASRRRR